MSRELWIVGAIVAAVIYAIAVAGEQFSDLAPEQLGGSPHGPVVSTGPATSGSNQGGIQAGTTPAEAADKREATAPGGDHEGPSETAFEKAAKTVTQTSGGVSQRTVTSGGVTQDDDESDQGGISLPDTLYEQARKTQEETGGGPGNRRFTVG